MSSELQLDICHLNRWRRHLVNAYEVNAGMGFIAGKTVIYMPEHFRVVCIPCKTLYKCSAVCFIYFSLGAQAEYKVTRCSAITERPHCRVHYSFGQK